MKTHFTTLLTLTLLFCTTVFSQNRNRNIRTTKIRTKVIKPNNRNLKTTNNYRTLLFNNQKYYYKAGKYYTLKNGVYHNTSIPNNALITNASFFNSSPILHKGKYFYYELGIFYTKNKNGFVTTKAPKGIIVDYLPKDAKIFTRKETTFYQVENLVFKQLKNQKFKLIKVL